MQFDLGPHCTDIHKCPLSLSTVQFVFQKAGAICSNGLRLMFGHVLVTLFLCSNVIS